MLASAKKKPGISLGDAKFYLGNAKASPGNTKRQIGKLRARILRARLADARLSDVEQLCASAELSGGHPTRSAELATLESA